MRAICVDESRNLQLRDIPSPSTPPQGYVTVKITAAAINHGDITFLKLPGAAGGAPAARGENVWGASAAGIVTQIGPDVPERLMGRKVAIYRSLQRDKAFLGLWCEIAQIPYQACLLLPDHVDARYYSGSLVNAVTAYYFLEQVVAEGHHGIVVTAGRSATGRAMTFLARRRNIPTLIIVRSSESKAEMVQDGVQHVLASDDPDFMQYFEQTARTLGTTAVFDGVGGAFIGQLLPALPPRSSIYFYGFLSGAEKVSFPSTVFMMKDLTMRRYSNIESPTIRDGKSLMNMLEDLEGCIEDPSFRTLVGQDFDLSEFDAAMEHKGSGGRKAVFVPSKHEA
jgi:NADPH:quinone reductase-like Zn-dependent oxidoreductase